MAASTYGTLTEFKPDSEPIAAYLERVAIYFDANDIPDEKRVSVLLSIIGPKTYALLRSLTAPALPNSKSLDFLVQQLKSHYQPPPLLIAERFHFNQRNQAGGESIADYAAELRRLAATCEFGDFLDDALRDRLVCGMNSTSTQKCLLSEARLFFAKALEVALALESAERNAKSLKGKEEIVQNVRQFHKGSSERAGKPCYRCGKSNHDANSCRFVDATCHNCGKRGHIATVCRSKKASKSASSNSRFQRPRPRNDALTTKYLLPASNQDEEDVEEFRLHSVESKSSQPIIVDMIVAGKTLRMEVDTGAAFLPHLTKCGRNFSRYLRVTDLPSSSRRTQTNASLS